MRKAVCLVLYDSNKRILIQHRDSNAPIYPNCWSFFGGGMEQGETPEQASIREAYEELEVKLKNPRLFHKEIYSHGSIKKILFYLIEKLDSKELIVLHEGDDMKWVFPHEINDLNSADILKNMIGKIEEELEKIN